MVWALPCGRGLNPLETRAAEPLTLGGQVVIRIHDFGGIDEACVALQPPISSLSLSLSLSLSRSLSRTHKPPSRGEVE